MCATKIPEDLQLLAFEIGKCTFFLCFSEHPSHAPVGYGEIPKSCTMENRQNLIEHQLYATIQRKQPPVPPFTTDTPAARKGFDTSVERLKRLNNGETAMAMRDASEMCPYLTQRPTSTHSSTGGSNNTMMKNNFKITNGNGGVVSGVHAVHGGAVVVGNHLGGASNSRCATLGRVKNLEMTEYQRQKFINGTDIPMV